MVAQNEHQEREALKFFRTLYGDAAPGYLPIWSREDRITRWLPAADLESAARIVAHLAPSRDVYFGAGLQPRDLGQNRRGEAKGVTTIPGLWADLDVYGAAHKGTSLPSTKEEARALLDEFPLQPTLIIDSGHGLQPWWLLTDPWAFDGEEERRRAQDLVRRFQATLQAKARDRGWSIDTTSDISRVMRPAGSWNHKLDPVPVRIVELDEERRYNTRDFEPYLSNDIEMPYRHAEPVGDKIPEGRRNDTIFRRACSMRAQGFDEESILTAILDVNRTQCDPPLPENEVRRIARSASKYEPGPSWATLQDLVANDPPRPPIPSAAPKVQVPAESKLRFFTAKEIAEMAPEEPGWLVRQYVVKGAVTDIVGKAKAGGKTTFVTYLCSKVLDGEPFMDLPTVKTGVVYLSEQSATTFREALGRAGLLDREDLTVVLWRDTISVAWPEIVREAAQEAVRRGAGLLVVDTLPQFAGLEGDGENSATAALAAMAPIQEAAATHDLAVILVRHERKSGGAVGDSGRGSSAFAGAVDIIVSIRRSEGAARPTIRELHALSRFDETPDVLVVELTGDGYRALGDSAAVAEAEAREAILGAAPTSEAEAARLEDLLETTGVGRTVTQEAIKELLEAGELRRVGGGVRGDPYRYWRPNGLDEGAEIGGQDAG
jgi:hypothetical protein